MGSSYMLPYSSTPGEGAHCKLPSIHSLPLDIPGYNRVLPPLYPSTLPPPQSYLPMSNVGSGAYLAPSPLGSMQQPTRGLNMVPVKGSYTSDTSKMVANHLISPVSSPEARNESVATLSSLNTEQNPNGSRSRSSSDPLRVNIVSDEIQPARDDSKLPSDDESKSNSTNINGDNEVKKSSWKPRKKKQCPECKQYFSNLATHKSTHLKPTSRPHICRYCNRGFARPNDLLRHIKCHWKEIGSDKGQFKCPFKNHSTGDHCCHNSGIFSRCDTFKNHLRAIHFQYPNGTKKDQRNKVSGNCRMCHQHFQNVDEWLNEHIEKNKCPYGNDIKKE
ncbi:uncharacterized protein PRCAT00001052001 [Priceomyces carsonii]|uniref:uncharacterized protein n=1 Tax=Priceomyces carsonii TaxID=28549 RepID=UPI002EDA3751|nr:unnamed protein product [Priceomyces carsonii]